MTTRSLVALALTSAAMMRQAAQRWQRIGYPDRAADCNQAAREAVQLARRFRKGDSQ